MFSFEKSYIGSVGFFGDPVDFTVFILGAGKDGFHKDWEGQPSVLRIQEHREKSNTYLAGGIDDRRIDIAHDRYLNFERVMKDDSHRISHLEVVRIDKKIMSF